jgi:hypothetical protein
MGESLTQVINNPVNKMAARGIEIFPKIIILGTSSEGGPQA